GLEALGRRAPRRHRVVPAAAAVGAAAHRMVDRVHADAANGRTNAAPAVRAGLADRAQVVLLVADLADHRAAVNVDLADLARAQAHLRVGAFAGEKLYAGACRASDLRPLAGRHLDAVDRRAHRDVAHREAVARLDRRFRARHELRTDRDAARRDDIAAL